MRRKAWRRILVADARRQRRAVKLKEKVVRALAGPPEHRRLTPDDIANARDAMSKVIQYTIDGLWGRHVQ